MNAARNSSFFYHVSFREVPPELRSLSRPPPPPPPPLVLSVLHFFSFFFLPTYTSFRSLAEIQPECIQRRLITRRGFARAAPEAREGEHLEKYGRAGASTRRAVCTGDV